MDLSRQTALDILIAWDRESVYPNVLIKDRLGKLADVRERTFCTNLVYGTIENVRRLDYWISKTSTTPFKKIHIVNRNILRMGLQQILYMNVPVSAACNTSVELAKRNGLMRSRGFVNAVLRKLSSSELPELPTGRDTESLGIRYSVNTTIIDLLTEKCGAEFTSLYFEALEKLPPSETMIAINTLKTDAKSLSEMLTKQGISVIEQNNDTLYIRFSLDISAIAAYKDGLFHIIGKPSYETAEQLDVSPGQTVLDLCSAPGGKTFAMAYRMKNKGRIIAADIHPHKVDQMEKEAKRLGITNIDFICSDAAREVKNWIGTADRVLCDVPCSGLGIIRKKPDIRYKDMTQFSLYETQKQILQNGLKYLKPDGRLVYSTCTVNPAENGDIVRACANGVVAEKIYLPQTDGTEGFYYAVLTAKGDND